MRVPFIIIGIAYFLGACTLTNAWDNDELEVFDIVEEVNQNFYDVLGVPQTASALEIKKAFRRLSLQLHPDKNPLQDAEQQFRKLVAVYDVLKDPGKRQCYDNVLINGLPNWRSTMYYYRHVRKMGFIELSIILFTVITVGQYLVAWAAYFEKRYTYEQVLGSKLQKMQKKNRKGKMDVPDLSVILEKIPTPSVWNTVPFQIVRWIVVLTLGLPGIIRLIYNLEQERKLRKKQEEEEALAQENKQPEPEPTSRVRRRTAGFTTQERASVNAKEVFKKDDDSTNHVYQNPTVSDGLWTDDDILIKLVKKYPGGTPDRWHKIADAMNRTVGEVTHMAKKVKEDGLKPKESTEEIVVEERPKKIKTRTENVDNVTEWSQEQQKQNDSMNHVYQKPTVSDGLWTDDDILIKLVKKYPGGTPDRWHKIADAMNRTVGEVTHMAKKVKEDGLKPKESTEEIVVEERPKKIKTRTENVDNVTEWSQEQQKQNDSTNHVYQKPTLSDGLWTDDDILIKLVKKYPGGTPDRWRKIADAMNRTVGEVTHMAKKVKEDGLKPKESTEEIVVEERPKKIKTRSENVDNVTEWSQEQQKALEAALVKYPKSTSIDRWEKIASCVEGKTKDECQARYKQLVDIVKKKQHPQYCVSYAL